MFNAYKRCWGGNWMKVSQKSVNYREGNAARSCASCTMFQAPHSCTHVAGKIDPGGLCDDYAAKELKEYKKAKG